MIEYEGVLLDNNDFEVVKILENKVKYKKIYFEEFTEEMDGEYSRFYAKNAKPLKGSPARLHTETQHHLGRTLSK